MSLGSSQERAEGTAVDRESLVAQRDLLREENDRLRGVVDRLHRARHRRAAAVLAGLALLALLGALAFPAEQTTLLALGGTGLFGAAVIRFLMPERGVSASVGERVYETQSINHEAIVAELALQNERLYVPTDPESVRLFIPQQSAFEYPSRDACDSTFVLTDNPRQRGVAFDPIGQALIDDLRSSIRGGLYEDPVAVIDQLADALVESLELADSATATVDTDDCRATIGVSNSAYGSIDRFDHPIASLFAVGLATALDEAITLTVTEGDGKTVDYLVSCRWDGATD